jgi:arabinan endo-1,5-alpha-L-arabinosidase
MKAFNTRIKLAYLIVLLCITGASKSFSQSRDVIVHDPVMIKQNDTYYVFHTGRGIGVKSSKDMKTWKKENPVFITAPDWAYKAIPKFDGSIWAPDISFHNGTYYLFYSVSAFGRNTSAIGVATNTTLNADDKAFKWVDQGIVVQSVPGRDMWNAIDPNLAIDKNGVPWLTFGSFWNGIKIVKLQSDMKSVVADSSQRWRTVAAR